MSGFRVMLALVFLTIAIPCIFVFEGMSAVTAVFFNRETWYDVMAEPALYDTFMAEFDDIMPESAAQREIIMAAASPAYVQSLLNKLVDYLFNVLDGDTSNPPVFDVPAPLAEALQRNPNTANFDLTENPDGGVQFTLNISERSLEPVRGLRIQFGLATVVSATVGFLLWFAAAWSAAESARGRFLWLGITLMVASFGVVIIGGAALGSVIPNITSDLTRNTAEMSGIELAISRGILGVIPRFATALTLAGSIPLGIGFLLALIGASLRPQRTLGRYQNS